MSRNNIALGEVRVGRVISEEESELPDQAATMTFDEERGVELHLPYFWEPEDGANPHYARAVQWFDLRESHLPTTLVFQDERGGVTLVGARVSGVSGRSACVGRVRAETVIFNTPRSIRPTYEVRQVTSTIDGLEEFADFRPVTHDTAFEDGGTHRTTVTVHADEAVTWEAEGFGFTIHSSVSWEAVEGRSFVIKDSRPTLITVSETGATPVQHVKAQWAVRALLSLLLGARTPWRSHEVMDNEFPLWGMGSIEHGPHNVQTLLSGTVKHHSAPPAESMPMPAFRLRDIGADGMRSWVERYADPRFERAVQPAVEVINGASAFLEPQLMMLAISLDRFGDYRFNDGVQRAMKTTIKRCLDDSGFDWSQVGSNEAIAASIANVNNDLKHPGRPTYPDGDVLTGVTRLARVIVRAQLFDLLNLDDHARRTFFGSAEVRNALTYFAHAGLTISDNGKFSRIAPEPEE
ncbi:hypothetical protein FQ330_03100 [Agrococcus sediminis]|uniref:ApeA N-terminal domain-containing protein n=1 Tax=Agrococcus sediminis TaxID=2599924 RepID=A0A5M8QNV2_9MICO|nr:hypothetical protein [Agrococcus sediminis]KAA6436406.1 hypothetical protein FQ330_03100 [Agrococcus sediminis]